MRYHLKDVIVGKIYFLLVRIKIRYMELAIVRRETTGAGDPLCERATNLIDNVHTLIANQTVLLEETCTKLMTPPQSPTILQK